MKKNKSLIVGCDMDGTLTYMSEFFLRHGAMFDNKVVNKKGYDIQEMYGVSKSKEFIWGLKYLVSYCKNAKVNQNTKRALKKLKKNNAQIYCITARKFVTKNNVLGAYMRSLVTKYNSKNKIYFDDYYYCTERDVEFQKYLGCHKYGVDLMFEDKPEVALYLADKGVIVGLVDTLYNKDINHKNIYRCKDAKDYDKVIDVAQKLKDSKNKVYNKEVKSKTFKSLEIEEFNKLSDISKEIYVRKYQEFIRKEEFDEEALELGEKRYKKCYRIIMLFTFRRLFTSIKGRKNIPYGLDVIYVSNHLDSFDQFSISYGISNNYLCGFAAKSVEKTLRGKIFKYFNAAVFIDRKSSISKHDGVLELEKYKVRNKRVLIFPEGTRKNKYDIYKDKELLDFKSGAFNLAIKTSSTIVPVALVKRKFRTTVIYGEPIVVESSANIKQITKEAYNSILNMIRKEA